MPGDADEAASSSSSSTPTVAAPSFVTSDSVHLANVFLALATAGPHTAHAHGSRSFDALLTEACQLFLASDADRSVLALPQSLRAHVVCLALDRIIDTRIATFFDTGGSVDIAAVDWPLVTAMFDTLASLHRSGQLLTAMNRTLLFEFKRQTLLETVRHHHRTSTIDKSHVLADFRSLWDGDCDGNVHHLARNLYSILTSNSDNKNELLMYYCSYYGYDIFIGQWKVYYGHLREIPTMKHVFRDFQLCFQSSLRLDMSKDRSVSELRSLWASYCRAMGVSGLDCNAQWQAICDGSNELVRAWHQSKIAKRSASNRGVKRKHAASNDDCNDSTAIAATVE